jgi:hypothetical protein
MNHGVVMFSHGDMPELRIWEMAMDRGEFVVIYATRWMGRLDDGTGCEPWFSALVPTTGEPPRFSSCLSVAGDDESTEYARYEPAYDGEFLEMCRRCLGAPWSSVVLPAIATDQEAMRLLGKLDSIQLQVWKYLYERFYVQRRHNLRNPKKSPIRLSNLMQPIDPRNGWAYFLGFFRDSVVVFLSRRESDAEGLFEPTYAGRPLGRQADWLYLRGVIEKW